MTYGFQSLCVERVTTPSFLGDISYSDPSFSLPTGYSPGSFRSTRRSVLLMQRAVVSATLKLLRAIGSQQVHKKGSSRESVQKRSGWVVESIGLIRYLEV